MKKTLLIIFPFFFFLFPGFQLTAQNQTVGLLNYEAGSFNGYTLFNPIRSTSTYLIDNCGRLVHEWQSNLTPGNSTMILENGNLLRTASSGIMSNPVFAFGGGGERIQEVDQDGNVLWEFIYSDSTHRMHHDFVRMPNGNLLMPAWELKTAEEAIEAGRDTNLLPDGVLWAEFIIEVEPATGQIVWEWHLWDHLIQDFDSTKNNYGTVADHPELFDINLTGGPTISGNRNQVHINSIDYNPMMDQILINSFFLSEFYIIDHSTTTAQAAGHSGGISGRGGDFLYRWGNPQNYDHGTAEDRTIWGAHNAHWIPDGLPDAGKIMYFHNGNGRPGGSHSSIDIIVPPVDDYQTGLYIYQPGVPFGPTAPEWSYVADPPENFYSNFLSGAQRLPNGNTLICSGANGRFFEINTDNEIVWEYINPVINGGMILSQGDTIPLFAGRNANIVFRCTRYGEDYPGLANYDLSPGDPIELNFPDPYTCEIISSTTEGNLPEINIFPNPARNFIEIEMPQLPDATVTLYNSLGQPVKKATLKTGRLTLDVSGFSPGIYFIKINDTKAAKILIGK
ncbi:MAG TPA: T9SS type A sorting domain-containing protein [Bacteroidetes bacterium]|nr:T9SS type A sorting domain-containing protein [Bacteroidota bacterium]